MIVCYDCADPESFKQASQMYKDLMRDPEDSTKVSRFAKVPVAFVGTKLDLTDFIRADMGAVPRCV